MIALVWENGQGGTFCVLRSTAHPSNGDREYGIGMESDEIRWEGAELIRTLCAGTGSLRRTPFDGHYEHVVF